MPINGRNAYPYRYQRNIFLVAFILFGLQDHSVSLTGQKELLAAVTNATALDTFVRFAINAPATFSYAIRRKSKDHSSTFFHEDVLFHCRPILRSDVDLSPVFRAGASRSECTHFA